MDEKDLKQELEERKEAVELGDEALDGATGGYGGFGGMRTNSLTSARATATFDLDLGIISRLTLPTTDEQAGGD